MLIFLLTTCTYYHRLYNKINANKSYLLVKTKKKKLGENYYSSNKTLWNILLLDNIMNSYYFQAMVGDLYKFEKLVIEVENDEKP